MSFYKNDDGANVVQFGTGDIEVCNGRVPTNDKTETWPCIIFIPKKPGEIGVLVNPDSNPSDPAKSRKDAHTVLAFTKLESIEVVISHLLQVKQRMLQNGLKVLDPQQISDEIVRSKSMSIIKIGITSGMRGHFPVMYDEQGPIRSGMTCRKRPDAVKAAINWAKEEFGENWKNHCDYTKADIG